MAHYAFLNTTNIVTDVIVGIDEDQLIDGISPEEWYGQFRGQKCLRTSYHGNIRVRYAGIGYRYDEARDAFIPPQPYVSWIFNETTLDWDPPVPYPTDGNIYVWDEAIQQWVEVQPTSSSSLPTHT
jgi:hypothetical protein